MARKKPPPEHENLERWLVSYADFMTLLFALFTTMYAISTVDAKKLGKMVLSMQAAFDPTGFTSSKGSRIMISEGGAAPSIAGTLAPSMLTPRAMVNKDGQGGVLAASGGKGGIGQIKEELSKLILDEGLQDKVKVVIKRHGVVLSLAEAGFFDSGQYKVRNASRPLLDKVCRYLTKLPNAIRVTGHSDNTRVRSARFASNWELSTARAAGIVSLLVEEHGFDPKRLAAAGYAEHRPVASNDTAEGRARNRRVDILIPAVSNVSSDPDGLD